MPSGVVGNKAEGTCSSASHRETPQAPLMALLGFWWHQRKEAFCNRDTWPPKSFAVSQPLIPSMAWVSFGGFCLGTLTLSVSDLPSVAQVQVQGCYLSFHPPLLRTHYASMAGRRDMGPLGLVQGVTLRHLHRSAHLGTSEMIHDGWLDGGVLVVLRWVSLACLYCWASGSSSSPV